MKASTDLLTKSSYFSDLSKPQLEKIAGLTTLKSFKKGELVLKESDKGNDLYMITSGRVEVSVSLVAQNKRETIATLGEGEIIGEMILLGKSRRTADVVAKDNVDVVGINVQALQNLFEADLAIGYAVMRNIAKQMAERLIATNQVLRNALTVSSTTVY